MKKESRRFAICLMVLLASFGMVFANGTAEDGSAAQPELESFTIKAGCLHGTEHAFYMGLNRMKEVVEAESDGRITMDIFPAGQMGTEPEMLDQVKMGVLTMTQAGAVDQFCPEMNALGMPFLFKNLDHAEAVLKGDIGKKYASYAEKKGYHVMGYVHNGFRQFTNNVHPIKTPADLKGLKMRVPPMDVMMKTMQALGATITPIAYGELYMALKTNVADGEENPFMQIMDDKFYEVQKYMTVVNYLYPVNCYVCSQEWWDSLSSVDKEIIAKGAEAGSDYTNELQASRASSQLEKLKDLMEVYVPTNDELQQFKDLVQPVYDWAISQGYATTDVYEEIQAMSKDY
jgi:tripartite ATP-independent transporter DctP family solute receptor